MRLSRRTFVGSGTAGLGLGSVLGGLTRPAYAAIRTGGTTLRSAVVRGAVVRDGYRRLRRIDGEPHLVRTDLGVSAKRGRARRRAGLSAFVQLSDVHIIDAQSPLRVEWLDRYDDEDSLRPGFLTSAYRPQEMLTAQVAEAMVRRINAIGRGPVSGRRLGFAVQTGDNSDNAQYNEIRWNIRALGGGRLTPNSGAPDRWEGVADNHRPTYDIHYWHPHGTPAGKETDKPRRDYGFPVVKRLLPAARRRFRASGLDMPWFTVFGNHDTLIQGNFPTTTTDLDAVARGNLKLISPPPGLSYTAALATLQSGNYQQYLADLQSSGFPGIRVVTADDRRRLLSRSEIVEEHFRTSGRPVGHGFTARNRSEGTAYYAVNRGVVKLIVLDTVNPNGYANGSIDLPQFLWLQQVLASTTRRLVVVCSHHTSDTMDNPFVATGGDPAPRVLGEQVRDELVKHRNVIAWVNGHTHTNRVTAHQRTGGGGFWEINTASHVDWPQHARILEILDNKDGTLSIFGTLVDHAAPVSYGGRIDNPIRLAALARELAANDWQHRDATRGPRNGRNVELLVERPAWLG
jgi:metallophosphoesterase (TIGR03767 family)